MSRKEINNNRFRDDMIGYMFGDDQIRQFIYSGKLNEPGKDKIYIDETTNKSVNKNYYIRETLLNKFIDKLINILSVNKIDEYLRKYSDLYIVNDDVNIETLENIDYLCLCIMHKLIEKTYEKQLDKIIDAYHINKDFNCAITQVCAVALYDGYFISYSFRKSMITKYCSKLMELKLQEK